MSGPLLEHVFLSRVHTHMQPTDSNFEALFQAPTTTVIITTNEESILLTC